ncbi:hypothetical protein Pint_27037 [Pistacia integerrima]|uniref:Uncharacterized protein n=1 Tax=Pistacia integerrima TaxID=434235 RepID=A0ACC0YRU9_9ROSI|nr:hypothetical protein Pint_27037 [Pistacia integerrima]
MATVSHHHRFFVVALLLCFISLSDGARSLGVVAPPRVSVESENNVDITPSASRGIHGGEVQKEVEEEEMVTVDYTPARKKPPIHN